MNETKPNYVGLGIVVVIVVGLIYLKPQPDPGPLPPDPQPQPVPGMRAVMIVEESGATNRANYIDVLDAVAFRSALTSLTTNTDGIPDWRIWDDDYTQEQLARVGPKFKALYEKAKADSAGRLPWILINGGRGYSGELPDTLPPALTLLQNTIGGT